MKFVIIPVKELSRAKNRLSNFLSLSERQELAFSMLTDVLMAACKSKASDKTLVVTNDERAIELANRYAIECIVETQQHGESESVDSASSVCMEMGARSVLRIPGDVPLITADDIDHILNKSNDKPCVLLVPSYDMLGTNAILRTPSNAIKSHFGYDSLRKHIEEAKANNIPHHVMEIPNVAMDVDEPKDLKRLFSLLDQKSMQNLNTVRILEEMDLMNKLKKLKITGSN